MNPVVLFGATGYTGRLIASKLVRSKIPFTAVGRNQERLERLVGSYKMQVPYKAANADDYDSVRKVLVRGTKVLINCVGPFVDHGKTVMQAAMDAKVHYLDTTGELYFMREAHWHFNDQAKKQKRLLVNAMAFEYSLGDFAAKMLIEKMKIPASLLEIFYYIPGFEASRGTKRSMIAAMNKPIYGFEGGRLVEIKAGAFRRNLHLKGRSKPMSALSFPGGEVFMVPRHSKVRSVREYMVMSVSAARLLYGNSPRVLKASSKARAAEESLSGDGPTLAQRKDNKFKIFMEALDDNGKIQVCTVSGNDVYGLTASIICHGVRQILAKKHLGVGVLSPAQAFEEKAFWTLCKRSGVKLSFGSSPFSS